MAVAWFVAVLALTSCGGGQHKASSRTTASTVSSTPTTGSSSTSRSQPGATTTAACGWAPVPPRLYQHVIWIWMENKTWDQVLGNASSSPYATSLANQCGTATHYSSVGRPSLPNYIGATSGSTQGISDDNSPSAHPITGDNLFRQVRASGGSERSYVEAMTSPCQLASGGQYAVKHNPASYYTGPGDRSACQADDVPFAAFANDLAQGRLPTFAFVTPDLCNDTHDCSVKTGDAWLAGHLPDLLNSPAYRSGTTAVFVIWDEETPMPNVIIAPSTRPGTVVTSSINHYSLLRTTEELLGLPTSLGAAASAGSVRAMFGL